MLSDATTQKDELYNIIGKCLDLKEPKSLFLFAGAGTGKTEAVIAAMEKFRDRYGQQFRQSGQKVAVITFTNAACDEIKSRIQFDPIFAVSTIHSFAWEQISSFHKDISDWLRVHISAEIEELRVQQATGRAGTKAAAERETKIKSNERRLKRLDTIKHFTYNPDGENIGKNSLSHSEVIAISAAFVAEKKLMRQILVRKHPFVFIDESQDTQKDLIDSFFALQAEYKKEFALFLFGDMMQRIYADGKEGLGQVLPDDWEAPALTINHRCPKRIVKLLNRIRADADGQEQEPCQHALEGVVRLFLVTDTSGLDRIAAEAEAASIMAEVACDLKWVEQQAVKTLTLEHHMAARRGGFEDFFEPLDRIRDFKTGLRKGKLPGVAFFAQQVLQLVQALQAKDRFAVAHIVKKHSLLLHTDAVSASGASLEAIRKAERCVQSLFSLWKNDADPMLIDILTCISDNALFTIPDVFDPILHWENKELVASPEEDGKNSEDDKNLEVDAWREALSVPFSQFSSYVEYVSERSPFATHQGVKGLQFPRVMVILDDSEARGFMFSYDKLVGAKAPTAADERNLREGRETSVDKTRRLFYVTCSRAQESLGVVLYTKEAAKVAKYMAEVGWFEQDEIVHLCKQED